MASYPASEQIPWLRDQYAAALAAWERNPADTVRRLEMGMIAVVILCLRTQENAGLPTRRCPGRARQMLTRCRLGAAEVEAIASGRTTGGRLDVRELGVARAELVRRDQEYAEQQEKIRQEFEREIERSRTERETNRQEFDAALARENREAARETAKLQLEATREATERPIRTSH